LIRRETSKLGDIVCTSLLKVCLWKIGFIVLFVTIRKATACAKNNGAGFSRKLHFNINIRNGKKRKKNLHQILKNNLATVVPSTTRFVSNK